MLVSYFGQFEVDHKYAYIQIISNEGRMLVNKNIKTAVQLNPDSPNNENLDKKFNITDILTIWGIWARQQTLMHNKPYITTLACDHKPELILDDFEIVLIDSLITKLGRLKSIKSQNEYKVLKLFYFGELITIHNRSVIALQTISNIANKMHCNETNIKEIKRNAENYVISLLAMQTMLTGIESDLFNRINLNN